MTISYKGWKRLFLFCVGLFAGAAFCMKWMESDFLQNGEKFTIIGMEISYSKEKVAAILAGLDEHVKSIVKYHLSFDFAFMAGVYPGISALCMMARKKSSNAYLRNILWVFALLQLVAWACDIAENCQLFAWIKNPVIVDEFGRYHVVVITKWSLALAAAILSVPLATRKRIFM